MSYVPVAIGVVIRSDGAVLVARRREGDRFAGRWEFPGGKVSGDESPAACLHRELKEELGITIRIVARLAPITHDYGNLRVCLHPFVARVESGEPKPLAAMELRWVSAEELAAMEFPEANAPLLAQLRSILKTMPPDA